MTDIHYTPDIVDAYYQAKPRVLLSTVQFFNDKAGHQQRLWVGKWNMAFPYEWSEKMLAEHLILFGQEILKENSK